MEQLLFSALFVTIAAPAVAHPWHGFASDFGAGVVYPLTGPDVLPGR